MRVGREQVRMTQGSEIIPRRVPVWHQSEGENLGLDASSNFILHLLD